jgi:hypothetical protein
MAIPISWLGRLALPFSVLQRCCYELAVAGLEPSVVEKLFCPCRCVPLDVLWLGHECFTCRRRRMSRFPYRWPLVVVTGENWLSKKKKVISCETRIAYVSEAHIL